MDLRMAVLAEKTQLPVSFVKHSESREALPKTERLAADTLGKAKALWVTDDISILKEKVGS